MGLSRVTIIASTKDRPHDAEISFVARATFHCARLFHAAKAVALHIPIGDTALWA